MIVKAILVAGLIGTATVSMALADEDKMRGPAPSVQVGPGFTATKVKPDDGGYKVKGYTANGQKEKFHVDANGAVSRDD